MSQSGTGKLIARERYELPPFKFLVGTNKEKTSFSILVVSENEGCLTCEAELPNELPHVLKLVHPNVKAEIVLAFCDQECEEEFLKDYDLWSFTKTVSWYALDSIFAAVIRNRANEPEH